MSKRKPNWTEREKNILIEEYEKKRHILKAKFSSSLTSGDKTRAWEEIAHAINPGSSVRRSTKGIQKKWDNICATAKTEVSAHRRSQKQTGRGPCSNDISSISQKVCDILGEDSPTISGIEGGVDIDEIDHKSVSNKNKRLYVCLPDSEDEDIPTVSKRQRISQGTTKTSSDDSNPTDPLIALRTEVLNLEKEKLKLQTETLKLEKEKLAMEKNKLALEITKLSFEMKTYGIDVDIIKFHWLLPC
ncbi:unnamed protein product [Mytilus coruscus]|uniref:Myb-like domain-containing protein n=1 Tax=Mytilus coruscus TaxID=42192 RepID=A0A6J8D6J3_MYTCO|nr:unnamed protein product [Mytilus coruscus]